MNTFPLHTLETAPAAAQAQLSAVKSRMGFLPNLHLKLAQSPVALEAYTTLSGIFEKASFSAGERQMILLAAAVENACEFCVAAHSRGAKRAKVDPAVLSAVRAGQPVPDDRMRALVEFTQAVVRERGWVGEDRLKAFLESGFTPQQVLEVIVGVTLKTLSNYTSHVADIPLNEEFAEDRWTPGDAPGAHSHRHAS